MHDIALNRMDHDLTFVQKVTPEGVMYYDLMAITDQDLIAQRIKIRLMTFLGEWFLDVTEGVPYLEQIMGKGTRESVIVSLLRGQILAVEGVTAITGLNLEVDPVTRRLTVDFECDTMYGPVAGSYLLDAIRENI